ncbi:MAG TPA: nucleotidyltransferase family protein, partial [Terriglobales bacterium]|nr:nucleotidyltransferase family protein [Terriglobales bacterium]
MNQVISALREPQALVAWTDPQWEMLVRQARSADLLGRIAALLDERALLDRVPAAPRAHLHAARRLALAQADEVRREVALIANALERTGTDIILLKGAAYLLAELPAAQGRVFSDVDILVPREALPPVEAALMRHGWATSHHEPYDQHYYREWMHELPPLRHVARGTVVDVHHSIAPPTGRFRPDSAKLLGAAVALAGDPSLKVLAPLDMVLHSAAHLFLNEDLTHGLRDLADIDALLRHFGAGADFWHRLQARARELDLERPLFYAARYANRIFETPAPAHLINRHSSLDPLYLRALQPHHPGATDRFAPLARGLLYVRGHWLRLPPALLVYHLTVKALRRP